jgi:cytochrome c oxidase cbb3-type subunit 4
VDIREIQAYAFFFFTAFLVFILYSYIIHLYRSEKNGTRDFEKYSQIALHDDITDKPVEELNYDENKDVKEKKS